MVLIAGVFLVLVTAAVFVFSLPRDGKTAWFVGKSWEGYVVVFILCVFGLGLMLVISSGMQTLKSAA